MEDAYTFLLLSDAAFLAYRRSLQEASSWELLLGYVSSHHLGETEVATVIELSLTFFHYALLPAIHLLISSVKKHVT